MNKIIEPKTYIIKVKDIPFKITVSLDKEKENTLLASETNFISFQQRASALRPLMKTCFKSFCKDNSLTLDIESIKHSVYGIYTANFTLN